MVPPDRFNVLLSALCDKIYESEKRVCIFSYKELSFLRKITKRIFEVFENTSNIEYELLEENLNEDKISDLWFSIIKTLSPEDKCQYFVFLTIQNHICLQIGQHTTEYTYPDSYYLSEEDYLDFAAERISNRINSEET